MTDLEKRINELLCELAPKSKTGKALSQLKDTLNSSSQIVDSVNNIGDSLQENITEEVGGVTGKVSGWAAGKATKLVGGVAGGLVAGTLKTMARVIPIASDMKLPETDREIAHCINTYALPADKIKLFDLLQYSWKNINAAPSPFGKNSIEALKELHTRVYAAFLVTAKEDKELLELAKAYIPKKRFGLF